MKRALILAAIAVVVVASGAMAQTEPLFLDSGNSPGEAPTGTGTLWDQTTACGGGSPASQLFPDFANSVLQAADDFVVPMGTSWTLERVFNQGSFFGGGGIGPFDSVIIQVFADAGGLPGAMVCEETGLASAGGTSDPNLDVTLDGTCVLTEGTYWMSMMVSMDFVPFGQYAWTVDAVGFGSEFAWQDPDGLIGGPCTPSWGLGITTCGIGATSPDLCFGIDGTEGGVPTMPLGGYVALLGLMALIGLVVLRRAF